MVVGHRSTVPEVLRKFGGREEVALEAGEYDSLFILVPVPNGSPRVLHLRF
jgi:hypothetical protein